VRVIGAKPFFMFQPPFTNQAVVYDADFKEKVIDYSVAASLGMPSTDHLIAQDTLYRWVKDNIGWANVYDLTVSNRGSKEYGCVNWANNAKNSLRVNSPTWTDGQGFSTNGTNSYMESGVTEVNLIQNNNTYGCYLYSGFSFGMGFYRQGSHIDKWLSHNSATEVVGRQKNSSPDYNTIVSGSKYRAVTRNNSANYDVYCDTKQTDTRDAVGSFTTAPFVIGADANAANGGGYVATLFTVKFLTKALTQTQHNGLNAAIATYIAATS